MKLSDLSQKLKDSPHQWLVTGGAGFIGSHLCEFLIENNQKVKCIDNLSTGSLDNLISFKDHPNFEFIEGSITQSEVMAPLVEGAEYVVHLAAMVSVQESFDQPEKHSQINVQGTQNLLSEAAKNKVKRVVLASSSAVYGDSGCKINSEELPHRPLSPYAEGKGQNEVQAESISQKSETKTTCLRFFNIYGPRQNPLGHYASVIPKWVQLLRKDSPIPVFGDGSSTRDFCYVLDVVKALILSAFETKQNFSVYNVGTGNEVTLLQLIETLQKILSPANDTDFRKEFLPERTGDIKHSCASIQRISDSLGFVPEYSLEKGLQILIESPQSRPDQSH